MKVFDLVAGDVSLRTVLRPGNFYPIRAGEIQAANAGQRPDLIMFPERIYRAVEDGALWQSVDGKLVLATDLGRSAMAGAPTSPVFLDVSTRQLLDGNGVPIAVGGTAYPEVLNFAALPGAAPEGSTYIVTTASGIQFINRKDAGIYRRTGGQWVYLGAVPEGYFTDNVARFFDNSDPTKQMAFELSGITAGQTRTLTIPNKSGTVAMLDDISGSVGAPTTGAYLLPAANGALPNSRGVAQGTGILLTDNGPGSSFVITNNDLGSTAVATHVAASDPHPQYLTPAEGNSTYQPVNSALSAVAGLTTAGVVRVNGSGGAQSIPTGVAAATDILTRGDGDTRYATIGHTHPDANTASSGFMSAPDKVKLDSISPNATQNASDASLRDRSTHTGTQVAGTISDFSEAVDDRVSGLLVAGSNITINYNDAGNALVISGTGGGGGGAAPAKINFSIPVVKRHAVYNHIDAGITPSSAIQATLSPTADYEGEDLEGFSIFATPQAGSIQFTINAPGPFGGFLSIIYTAG